METFSALLAICVGNSQVSGECPSQRPVTRSFDVFCDLRLNKRLNKQSWGWWFETPSRSLWRNCNGYFVIAKKTPLSLPSWVNYGMSNTSILETIQRGITASQYEYVSMNCAIASYYSDVIMSAIASQVTGVSIIYSTVCSGTHQRKHQSPRYWPL